MVSAPGTFSRTGADRGPCVRAAGRPPTVGQVDQPPHRRIEALGPSGPRARGQGRGSGWTIGGPSPPRGPRWSAPAATVRTCREHHRRRVGRPGDPVAGARPPRPGRRRRAVAVRRHRIELIPLVGDPRQGSRVAFTTPASASANRPPAIRLGHRVGQRRVEIHPMRASICSRCPTTSSRARSRATPPRRPDRDGPRYRATSSRAVSIASSTASVRPGDGVRDLGDATQHIDR